jgi:hypothetical protein
MLLAMLAMEWNALKRKHLTTDGSRGYEPALSVVSAADKDRTHAMLAMPEGPQLTNVMPLIQVELRGNQTVSADRSIGTWPFGTI